MPTGDRFHWNFPFQPPWEEGWMMTGFRLTSVARERQPTTTTTTRSTFAGGPITSTSSSDRHGFIDFRPTYYSTRRYAA